MKDIGACNHLSNCNLRHEDKKHLRPERKPRDDAKYTINKSEHTPRPSLSIWMNPFYIVCYSLLSSNRFLFFFTVAISHCRSKEKLQTLTFSMRNDLMINRLFLFETSRLHFTDIDLLQITELQLQFFTNQITEFFLICLWQELGANPF